MNSLSNQLDYIVSVGSNDYVSCNTNSELHFKKHDGSSFSVNDIVLFSDLKNNQELLYQVLFENIKRRYPAKEKEYDALLELNQQNYRLTVLSIECENIKSETEELLKRVKNGFTSL